MEIRKSEFESWLYHSLPVIRRCARDVTTMRPCGHICQLPEIIPSIRAKFGLVLSKEVGCNFHFSIKTQLLLQELVRELKTHS